MVAGFLAALALTVPVLLADDSTLEAVGQAYQKNHVAQEHLPASASAAERKRVHDQIWAPALQKMANDTYKKQQKFFKKDLPNEMAAFNRTIREHAKNGSTGLGSKGKGKKPVAKSASDTGSSTPKTTGRIVGPNDGPVESGAARDVKFGGPRQKKAPGSLLAPATRSSTPDSSNPSGTGGAGSVDFNRK